MELDQEHVIRIWKLLENIRVSLDRIGAINSQGRDKMLQAMDEYFTPSLYNEIRNCSLPLTKMLDKTIGKSEIDRLCREIDSESFHLKKY